MHPFDNEKIRLNSLLACEIDSIYHEMATKVGLSDSSMRILYVICIFGDSCLLYDICRLSGISKQTINSSIRKMESEEILYLKVYDRKKKMVCLTEKGKKLTECTVKKIMEMENSILQNWTQEELEFYVRLTDRYLNALKEKMSEL